MRTGCSYIAPQPTALTLIERLSLKVLANGTELPDTTLTGLKSKGIDVHYHVVSATEIDGVAGTGASARTVFTLVQTAGGDTMLGTSDDVFTFTLNDQLDHATASGDSSTGYRQGVRGDRR